METRPASGEIMKPFEELSYPGRIRRMRQLAQAALNNYGLSDARFRFLRWAGNTLFRVNEIHPTSTTKVELYTAGQYMLRIHQPGYQSAEAIELELMWLAAMCREADLPVPEPVPTLEGKWLTQVSIPGVPGSRNASLLRWVRGSYITRDIKPHHYRAQGRLMARLHEHAAHWHAPAGITKRKYDWEGLFRDDPGEGIPASKAWALLPAQYIMTFRLIASKVKLVMDKLGKGSEVYGLIHGDLGLDANMLFWKGEARAIDFDDSGFGYYLYDLSVALENCQAEDALPQFREALLDGYTQVRSLPEYQLNQMDLFLAAFYVYWSLWAATAVQCYPNHKDELLERMERYFRRVQRYLASHG
jgi:Ser/Thr protein kinase RdoA (MazF antagonist)